MSAARKCDRCATLFERELGCMSIDIHLATAEDVDETEEEFDFCPGCGKKLRAFLDGQDQLA